jgi:YaiO family outer membrane protein
MLIPLALLSVTLLASPQAPDARAQAERLARSGSHSEALKQFQALAAANPDDVESRIWIARLHAWMGHPERAADVYESIIATQPQNVEALVGLGSALTSLGRLDEAGDALNRAEAIAASNVAVLAAQGRLHHAAGRGTLAEAYFLKAVALQPDDADVQAAYSALEAERAHRVHGSYYFEDFNQDIPATHAGIFELNARVGDSVRVFAGVHTERKFRESETRGGGGLEWSPRPDLHVRGGGLFTSDTIVLPRVDAAGDLTYKWRGVGWLGVVRYLDFAGSSTWIVSPGVSIHPSKDFDIAFRYYHSYTGFADSSTSQGNDGVSILATGRTSDRLSLTAGYIHGFEGLTILTSEYLSQHDANTITGGFMFDLQPMTSIGTTVEYQWRAEDIRVATVLLTLIQRF